jgi:hypothetical protein
MRWSEVPADQRVLRESAEREYHRAEVPWVKEHCRRVYWALVDPSKVCAHAVGDWRCGQTTVFHPCLSAPRRSSEFCSNHDPQRLAGYGLPRGTFDRERKLALARCQPTGQPSGLTDDVADAYLTRVLGLIVGALEEPSSSTSPRG